jgi:plastocyanin
MRRFLFLWALCLGTAASAGTLTVTVRDAQGQPVQDAVVYLDSDAARAASKPSPGVRIVQKDRRFVPAVSVVQAGTAVDFPNEDTVRHHVYSFSSAKTFELKLYAGTPADPVRFDKPGVAVLGCNIHDRMVAWVVVLQTPWHARTGADGVARIEGVPAGGYRLRGWHDGLPPEATPADQAVTLTGADAAAALTLETASR